jgi:hypothetical protein
MGLDTFLLKPGALLPGERGTSRMPLLLCSLVGETALAASGVPLLLGNGLGEPYGVLFTGVEILPGDLDRTVGTALLDCSLACELGWTIGTMLFDCTLIGELGRTAGTALFDCNLRGELDRTLCTAGTALFDCSRTKLPHGAIVVTSEAPCDGTGGDKAGVIPKVSCALSQDP